MAGNMIKDYGGGYGGGYGYGYGGGGGYGYGDGDGCGSGYGDKIGSVANYDVHLIRPWRLLAIGCECLPVSEWIENWRSIAEDNDIPHADKLAVDVERLTELVQEKMR